MRWLRALRVRLNRGNRGDLSEELRFHLEKEVELNVARGMPIDEARWRALVAFGGVQQTRENVMETVGCIGSKSWCKIAAMAGADRGSGCMLCASASRHTR